MTPTFRAGAARVELRPALGTQVAGDIGRRRPLEEVRDPLFASAIVLEMGAQKVGWLSLDLTILAEEWTDAIRRAAAERLGLEFGAIMVCATQTHSAPALGHQVVRTGDSPYIPDDKRWLGGGDDAFHALAVEKSVEALERAHANLQPANMAAASGIEARVAFNRRFVMRDGTAQTHPPTGSHDIRYCEGPIDPEVGVLCLRGADDTVLAALLHYTCHPTHGYPHRYASADWPGVWGEGAREIFGAQCVPFVLNGCCGNIHHANHLDAQHSSDSDGMGEKLTQTTREIAARLQFPSPAVLDWRAQILPLAWRDLDASVFQNARALLQAHPEPMWSDDEHTAVAWDWVYAVSLLDLQKQMAASPHFPYEIQVFRVGEIALAAWPGEPFVEAQLRLKLESPAYPTYVAHMANSYAGYIPTAAALERGGYETRPGNWSKLGPGALNEIVEATQTMLGDLFAEENQGGGELYATQSDVAAFSRRAAPTQKSDVAKRNRGA